ncbi:MAG: hypothetical protein ABUL47_08465, partial [Leifsonia sp.]
APVEDAGIRRLWTRRSVDGMARTRTVSIGGRDARLTEQPLMIGGIPVIWMLDSATWSDGTPVPPDELRAAGIRVPRKLAADDD